ncbi:MAG: hypothetical protein LBK56_12465 [Gracilibacteraceae bacterium]|jgi:hypothetical protein|nr:hypothetical protein [Gracilibacteraceae bacterium]
MKKQPKTYLFYLGIAIFAAAALWRSLWYITLFTLAAAGLVFAVFSNYMACFVALGALFIHAAGLFVFINIYNKRI